MEIFLWIYDFKNTHFCPIKIVFIYSPIIVITASYAFPLTNQVILNPKVQCCIIPSRWRNDKETCVATEIVLCSHLTRQLFSEC